MKKNLKMGRNYSFRENCCISCPWDNEIGYDSRKNVNSYIAHVKSNGNFNFRYAALFATSCNVSCYTFLVCLDQSMLKRPVKMMDLQQSLFFYSLQGQRKLKVSSGNEMSYNNCCDFAEEAYSRKH